MHSLMIAACFIAIVLAPCLAAQWTGTIRLWEEREIERKVPVAEVEVRELDDPEPSAVFQQRAALLKCARTQRVRQMHLPVDGVSTVAR